MVASIPDTHPGVNDVLVSKPPLKTKILIQSPAAQRRCRLRRRYLALLAVAALFCPSPLDEVHIGHVEIACYVTPAC